MKIAVHSEDIDGIVSAALLLKVFPDAEVKFLTVYEAQKTSEYFDIVADLIKPKNARVIIDHHKTNFEKMNAEGRISYEDLIDPSAPSAASLVAKKFNLQDEVSKELVRIANLADTGHLKGELFYLDKLIKMHVNDQGYLLKLARILSIVGANFHSDEWLSRELSNVKQLVKDAGKKVSEVVSELADKGIKFAIFDVRGVPFYIAKDFAGCFSKKGGYVGVSIYYDHLNNLRCSIRISSEFNKISANKLAENLGGGGHEKAAGCLIKNLNRTIYLLLDVLSDFDIVAFVKVDFHGKTA